MYVVRAMSEGETMILGAGVVIGTMIETRLQFKKVVRGQDLESVLEIMTVIGTNFLDYFFIITSSLLLTVNSI
jgi:hypothetical protein